MNHPAFLKKGDRIAILSTARKIEEYQLQSTIKLLESWGLVPVLGQTIGSVSHQFAGSDELRAADFQHFLDDPDISAILFAKGGYGTIRIIDKIDFSAFIKKPKWLCGFSDITVIHSHVHSNTGIPTLHSLMCSTTDNTLPEAINTLQRALFGESLVYEDPVTGSYRPGKCSGILTGGNMSIIYSLLGSLSDTDTRGKILFLEDLDEYRYHIDRIIISLKRAGMLNNLQGLIVGGMTEMKDNDIPFGMDANEIIMDAVKEFDYPVIFNFPCGHIDDNRTLRLGMSCELEINDHTFCFKQ